MAIKKVTKNKIRIFVLDKNGKKKEAYVTPLQFAKLMNYKK